MNLKNNNVRLVYYSQPSQEFNQKDIQKILDHSIAFNKQKDITGILVYDENYFMQLLDGDRDEVNALYNRIVQDSRHKDVRLIHYGNLLGERFTEWSMGIAYLPAFPKARIETKYGGFVPPRFTVEDAVHYLIMLREYTVEFMESA